MEKLRSATKNAAANPTTNQPRICGAAYSAVVPDGHTTQHVTLLEAFCCTVFTAIRAAEHKTLFDAVRAAILLAGGAQRLKLFLKLRGLAAAHRHHRVELD